jgi:hypothetical protein
MKKFLIALQIIFLGFLFPSFAAEKEIVFYNEFQTHPLISSEMREFMTPFILPYDHPIKPMMDALFTGTRVIQDADTLEYAGFKILSQNKRSYIKIVKHPLLPDHLLKIYTDDELRIKKKIPSWKWLVQRCQGAKQVRQVIQTLNLLHFQVPNKWLYPLPPTPSPPVGPNYFPKPVVLVVDKINLVSTKKNLYAWRNLITKEHLNELYQIITHAHGSSYRPDNIWYGKNGKFSFIDTEYPNHEPDYRSIRHYLNHEMRDYWDSIVIHGGPERVSDPH